MPKSLIKGTLLLSEIDVGLNKWRTLRKSRWVQREKSSDTMLKNLGQSELIPEISSRGRMPKPLIKGTLFLSQTITLIPNKPITLIPN